MTVLKGIDQIYLRRGQAADPLRDHEGDAIPRAAENLAFLNCEKWTIEQGESLVETSRLLLLSVYHACHRFHGRRTKSTSSRTFPSPPSARAAENGGIVVEEP